MNGELYRHPALEAYFAALLVHFAMDDQLYRLGVTWNEVIVSQCPPLFYVSHLELLLLTTTYPGLAYLTDKFWIEVCSSTDEENVGFIFRIQYDRICSIGGEAYLGSYSPVNTIIVFLIPPRVVYTMRVINDATATVTAYQCWVQRARDVQGQHTTWRMEKLHIVSSVRGGI